MEDFVTYVKIGAGAIGAFIGTLVGKFDGMLYALLAMMAIDFISGILVGIKDKSLSSEICYSGLMKKIFIFLFVIVGNVLDVYVIGAGAAVRSTIIMFYIANEGLSILENAGNFGVPYPDTLKAILAQLKDKDHTEQK